MVGSVNIEGLFNRFNYKILFSNEDITILTGPNGFGKSTIIHGIQAIANSDLSFFEELAFRKFEIESDNGVVHVSKDEDNLIINGETVPKHVLRYLSRGIRPAFEDVQQYNEYRVQQLQYNDLLQQMKTVLPEVTLIKEQRLIKQPIRKTARMHDLDRSIESLEVIRSIPEQMIDIIKENSSRYAKVANELDSTFPERLFHQEKELAENEFHKKMEGMKEKVSKLNRNGITAIQELRDVQFRQEDARALKVYFEDFDKKYEQYCDLVARLELFREIINSRFRFKHIEIVGKDGFVIIDNDTKKPISLVKLSSGEKEIVVLFFELLFKVPDNSLLLIDEPEMSLHIAWQRLFIKDLKQIAKLRNLQVLVATHSPQLINGNWDIQRDLGELYKREHGFN